MNTNLKTKKRLFGCLLLAAFILAPVLGANAQNAEDEFGVWTTLEASKKINKKLKLDFEAELRTIEGVGDIDRVSVGAGASYKLAKWLKASAGYIFISANESPVVRRVRAAAHGRAGKQAHRVGALGLIQVLVRRFLSPLKTVCSWSTPHIITIAQSEKANSK